MEIKVNQTAPFWLTQILSRHRCILRRVSKYCRVLEPWSRAAQIIQNRQRIMVTQVSHMDFQALTRQPANFHGALHHLGHHHHSSAELCALGSHRLCLSDDLSGHLLLPVLRPDAGAHGHGRGGDHADHRLQYCPGLFAGGRALHHSLSQRGQGHARRRLYLLCHGHRHGLRHPLLSGRDDRHDCSSAR